MPSQTAIGQLADRIERAYRRRDPLWQPIGLSSAVWACAASRLFEASMAGSSYPIDPELFVAVQLRGHLKSDPWAELTQPRSLQRYLKAVRRIVGRLREELLSEVRLAESCLLRGVSLDQILESQPNRISPLSRYILAHRAGRHDLSRQHRSAAENQHRSCPLYQIAARTLLPRDAYPLSDSGEEKTTGDTQIAKFSLN